MRILSFILSVFMFSASLLPCADGLQAAEHQTEHANHEHSQDHQDDEHKDTCAPFCHCDCCSISVVEPNFTFYESEIAIIPLQNESYYSFNYAFDFSTGVWHPPSKA